MEGDDTTGHDGLKIDGDGAPLEEAHPNRFKSLLDQLSTEIEREVRTVVALRKESAHLRKLIARQPTPDSPALLRPQPTLEAGEEVDHEAYHDALREAAIPGIPSPDGGCPECPAEVRPGELALRKDARTRGQAWLAASEDLSEVDTVEQPKRLSVLSTESLQLIHKTLEMNDFWRGKIESEKHNSGYHCYGSKLEIADQSDSEPEPAAQKALGIWKNLIGTPGSNVRIAWDFAGGIFVVYDALVIPLTVFRLPPNTFLEVLDWVTLIFWTLNVFHCLTLGYVSAGTTVMDPLKILINYLQGWCIVDLITLVPDWYFTIDFVMNRSSYDEGLGAEEVKMMRIFRLTRCVRLLRLGKLKKMWDHIKDMLDSQYVNTIINIIKMILFLVVINHYVACLWYVISYNIDLPNTWINSEGLMHSEWITAYLLALHWSCTQFTPASMPIQPQNNVERAFCVCVILFALVGFAYIVGSISSSLTKLRTIEEETSSEFWNLRKYLRQQQVPRILGQRVQRYLEHAWSGQVKRVNFKTSKLYKLLSDNLAGELMAVCVRPQLSVHPLLDLFYTTSPSTMLMMCQTAVQGRILASGDQVYMPGDNAKMMYIVAVGKLKYCRVGSPTPMNGQDSSKAPSEMICVGDHAMICEHILWLAQWSHLGILTVEEDCELVACAPGAFAELFKARPEAVSHATKYAGGFYNLIRSTPSQQLSDVLREAHIQAMRRHCPLPTPTKTTGGFKGRLRMSHREEPT